MWIRSQHKGNLVKTTSLEIEARNSGKYEIWDYQEKHQTFLGEYSTKERALEVLDEIQDKIAIIETMRIMGVTELTSKMWEKVTREKEVRAVYQMPEE